MEALARKGAQARTLYRCRGLHVAGQLCCVMGRYDEAREHLEDSLSIARDTGNDERHAAVLQPLGMACVGQGDLARARFYAEDAVALTQVLGDKRQLAAATNALAQLHRMEGELETAAPLFETVIQLARDLGDQQSIAIGLLNLSMVLICQSSNQQARGALIEVVRIAEEIGSKPVSQSALEVSAALCVVETEHALAARFLGAAEAEACRIGLQRDPEDEAFLAPFIERAKEALGVERFTRLENTGRPLGHADALAELHAWLRGSATYSGYADPADPAPSRPPAP